MAVPKWLKWQFVTEHVIKGMLQAIGGLLIYIGVIVYILYFAINSSTLKSALALRMPGLVNATGTGTGPGMGVADTTSYAANAATYPTTTTTTTTHAAIPDRKTGRASSASAYGEADGTALSYTPYAPAGHAVV